eukprot:6233919-Amphidinium_carterae.1
MLCQQALGSKVLECACVTCRLSLIRKADYINEIFSGEVSAICISKLDATASAAIALWCARVEGIP